MFASRGWIGTITRAAAIAALTALAGCPAPQGDAKKSSSRLELAKDFLTKHELDAADAEANRSLAFLSTNDEALNVRGLVNLVRALDAQRLLEVDGCLTGVDAEALSQEIDGDLAKASVDFEHAAKISPEYGEAWSNRGVVANLTGAYQDATVSFEKALENPQRLENPGLTRADLGWSYFHLNDYVRAAKELRQSIQFQPGMCVATYRLGRVYFAREEWDKAAELFQSVSEQTSCGSQEASFYLMKTRLQQGLPDDARKAKLACLQLSPKSCIAAQCRTEGKSL